MKKSFKKFGVIVLALAMVFALTIPAMAADGDTPVVADGEAPASTSANDGSVYTDDSLTVTADNKIPMTKSIIFFNLNGSKVYEPNITYTYSVAPVTTDSLLGTITDDGEYNENVPVTVKANAGVENSVSFEGTANTIAFSSDNTIVTTDTDGVKVTKSTNLTVDVTKFTHAGVYRYLITETDNSAAVTAAGMVRGTDYSRERYLDVYIKNNADGTAFELSGAVIFKTNAVDSSKTPGTTGITTTTEKTTGFEPGVEGQTGANVDYTSDTAADHYTTYDFTVKKVITGNFANKTHEFPFYVAVSNSINGAKFTYTADGSETFTGATNASGVVTLSGANFSIGSDSKDSSLKLKNDDTIKLVGVPSSQANALSVTIKEYNDSSDEYSASATVANGTAPAVTMDGAATATKMAPLTGNAALAAFNVKENDTASQIITVTNTLAQISPTGVVMRVAPFAAMGAAGIVFLAVSKKSKKEEEEA